MAEAPAPAFHDGLAAELERAGNLLEDLAVTLCLDPIVFERHAESLQRFDLVTQTIREVARAVHYGCDRPATVADIRLDAMAARMAIAGSAA